MPLFQTIGTKCVRLLGDQSRLTRMLRPAYAKCLEWVAGERGISWSINGQPFRIDPRFRWQMDSHYDRDVADYIAARIRPGQVVLDVGANMGVYALQFGSWVGNSGKVYAFEPNPGARQVLQRHVRMNRFQDRIEIVPSAVSSCPGEAEFFARDADGMSRLGSANPLLEKSGEIRPLRVSITTLDEFCRERAVTPDWLLLDIEGFEIAALRGAREMICRHRARMEILVELHPASWQDAGTSRRDAQAILEELELCPFSMDGSPADLEQYGMVALRPASS
ncbi:MAG: FkbM family methyltransferase [Tepidisphaeraceae bacterium]